MATRKRNVEIEVLVKDQKARAAMKGVADQATKTGDAFGKMGKLLVGAFAFDKVKDFVGSSITAFTDLNESLNAVNVTFGDSADEVQRLGKEAATSVGLSNAEFNSLAVQMSAFAQTIAGDSGNVSGTIDEMTTRVADFASVMNLDVAEAARLFQSGLAGETEPLRKFGIDLSAAAVTAHGLAMGLGDSSGQLSEQEKILARYDSLMEQTNKTAGDFENTSDELANRQRILAAEMENSKAAIGEGFAPALEAALPLIEGAAQGAGKLATIFMEMTGQIDDTDAAIRLFEQSTGATADTAAALLTIAKDFKVPFSELVPALGLSREELDKLTGSNDEFLLSIGFTKADLQELAEIINNQVRSATAELSTGMDRARHSVEKAGAAAEITEEQLDNLEEQMREMIDPAFALIDASSQLAEKQQAVTDAVDEFGEGSPEHIQALEDLTNGQIDFKVAQDDFVKKGPAYRGELREQLEALGLTRAEIDTIINRLEILETIKIGDKTFNVNVRGNTGMGSGGLGWPELHHGGIVQGTPGSDVPIIAQAGEAVIPKDALSNPLHPFWQKFDWTDPTQRPALDAARMELRADPFANATSSGAGAASTWAGFGSPISKRIRGGFGSNPGGLTIIINGFVGSEPALAAELDRLLTNRKRRNGLSLL